MPQCICTSSGHDHGWTQCLTLWVVVKKPDTKKRPGFLNTLAPGWIWGLGQVTWAKMTPKLLHLWRHSQKIHTTQPKNFFRVQST